MEMANASGAKLPPKLNALCEETEIKRAPNSVPQFLRGTAPVKALRAVNSGKLRNEFWSKVSERAAVHDRLLIRRSQVRALVGEPQTFISAVAPTNIGPRL